MPTLFIDCRVPEFSAGLADSSPVRCQFGAYSISTQELISLSVRAHMALRRIAQDGGNPQPPPTTLTPEAIASSLASGRVALPRTVIGGAAPDPVIQEQTEIQRAIQAFESGQFQIVVDGMLLQPKQSVVLHETAQVVFLRLMPLVGG